MSKIEKDRIVSLLKEQKGIWDREGLRCLAFSEDRDIAEHLYRSAREITDRVFGRRIFFRGLIEFTGYCGKNCYYCGLRVQNTKAERYRMTKEEILLAVEYGYERGFRTFVLQGGEDNGFKDGDIEDIIREIKKKAGDAAVTLSLGEKEKSSYRRFKEAGADRYLLRHEAFNPVLYSRLHPEGHSYERRIRALYELKELGYQVGAGFMVGAPFQTEEDILDDLMFLYEFKPQMIGIGPFISQKDTPFSGFSNGSSNLTLRLLSVIRVMLPNVLLPATTSLETAVENGRIRGFLHGANVIMPNLSPKSYRERYKIYDNKSGIVADEDGMKELRALLQTNGFELVIDRGDYKEDV